MVTLVVTRVLAPLIVIALAPNADAFSLPKRHVSLERRPANGAVAAAASSSATLSSNDSDDENDNENENGSNINTSIVSRRSAITTLTALALGGKTLTTKPKPSSANEVHVNGIKQGVAALESRPPVPNRGLAATAAMAAGWGSSVDMPTYVSRPKLLVAPAVTADFSGVNPIPHVEEATKSLKLRVKSWLSRSQRVVRALVRLAEIVLLALPAAVSYPFVMAARKRRMVGDGMAKKLYDRWLNLCIQSAERGGAVIIKLCQWASSRPDIFGTDFGDKFEKLQDSTTPHKWHHTEKCLRESFGDSWRDQLRIERDSILGSGCIAQVYKGYVTDDDGNEQPVAIKVVHPGVRKVIAKDLQILRYVARTLEKLPFGYGEKLRWNNLRGTVEEFAAMLEPQLDLRNEAKNIKRFNENFKKEPRVIFPQLVKGYESSHDVLVETFCSGVTVKEFCETNKDDKELRAKICELGAHTMCTMIFDHNYVHGDLHPGNILVSPDNKLIILDCGIVNEYSEREHDLAINVIAAFIRLDGRRAAEFLVDHSNESMLQTTGEQALDVEHYLDEIEKLSKAPLKGGFAFERVTMYINYVMNSASRHHVKITPAFVSMALAIKVQEGIALMLNPRASIINVANPIIIKAEARRLKQGGFDRLKTIAEDNWRDFRVRRERERDALALAAATPTSAAPVSPAQNV